MDSPYKKIYEFENKTSPKAKTLLSLERIKTALIEVNQELWIILTLLVLAFVTNYLFVQHHALLGLYSFPTVISAYFYGRRHAVLTAFFSCLLVGILAYYQQAMFNVVSHASNRGYEELWYEIIAWGSSLLITAYIMGTLYQRYQKRSYELRQSYEGLIHILQQFVAKDKYTENHSYRVSIYAQKIASQMNLSESRIEDVRAAALLHDIGKLDISRDILYKAATLTSEEYKEIKKHVDKSGKFLEPVRGPLHRIIPIILAHHEKYDGSGYHAVKKEKIPLEARIIAVADVYDSLASDRPYRKAMSPFEAKEVIEKGIGTEFDPKVVVAFSQVFNRGGMEVPEVYI